VISPGAEVTTRRSSQTAVILAQVSGDSLAANGSSHKDGRQKYAEPADAYAVAQPNPKSAKAERLARSPDELITLVQVLPSDEENDDEENAEDGARTLPRNRRYSRGGESVDNIEVMDGLRNSNQAANRGDQGNRCRWSIGADGNIWILQLDAAASEAKIQCDNTPSLSKHISRSNTIVENNTEDNNPDQEGDYDFIENNKLTIRQSTSTDHVLGKLQNLKLQPHQQQPSHSHKPQLNKHDSETDLHILSPSSDDGKRRRFSLARSVETAQIDVDDCFNGVAEMARSKNTASLSEKKCAHWLSDDVWFSEEGGAAAASAAASGAAFKGGQSCGQQDGIRFGGVNVGGGGGTLTGGHPRPGWKTATPKSPEDVLRLIHVTSV